MSFRGSTAAGSSRGGGLGPHTLQAPHGGVRRLARGGAAAGWVPTGEHAADAPREPWASSSAGSSRTAAGAPGQRHHTVGEPSVGSHGGPVAGSGPASRSGIAHKQGTERPPAAHDAEESRLMAELKGLDAKMKAFSQTQGKNAVKKPTNHKSLADSQALAEMETDRPRPRVPNPDAGRPSTSGRRLVPGVFKPEAEVAENPLAAEDSSASLVSNCSSRTSTSAASMASSRSSTIGLSTGTRELTGEARAKAERLERMKDYQERVLASAREKAARKSAKATLGGPKKSSIVSATRPPAPPSSQGSRNSGSISVPVPAMSTSPPSRGTAVLSFALSDVMPSGSPPAVTPAGSTRTTSSHAGSGHRRSAPSGSDKQSPNWWISNPSFEQPRGSSPSGGQRGAAARPHVHVRLAELLPSTAEERGKHHPSSSSRPKASSVSGTPTTMSLLSRSPPVEAVGSREKARSFKSHKETSSLSPLEQRLLDMHAVDTFPPAGTSSAAAAAAVAAAAAAHAHSSPSGARKSLLSGNLTTQTAPPVVPAAATAAAAAAAPSSEVPHPRDPEPPPQLSTLAQLPPAPVATVAPPSVAERPEPGSAAVVGGSIGSAAAASAALGMEYNPGIGLDELDNISFASESDTEELSSSVPYRTISCAAAAASAAAAGSSSASGSVSSSSALLLGRPHPHGRGETLLALSAAIEELEKSTSPAAAAVAEMAAAEPAPVPVPAPPPKPKTLWRSMKKGISHTLFGTKEERAAKSAAAEAAASGTPVVIDRAAEKKTLFGRGLWNMK